MSDQRERIIRQRKHARKAVAELECLLEEYVTDNDDDGYDEMQRRVDDLKKWLFEESSIS